jgi:hypothetical protein
MSIDVEGLDYEVLNSNNWSKYRPRYLLIEVLGSSLDQIEKSKIGKYMKDIGYIIYAKCMHTIIFKESA